MAAAQVAVIKESPPPRARAQDLRAPPPPIALALAAAGDPATLGKALMLRLQAFDNQPGISIPFRDLDYGAVGEWLDAIVSLDERAQYPHFSAANIYAIVNEKERQRQMVIWVRDQFVKNPTTRWEAMSRAAVVAHHYIKDIPLSLEIARLLRENLKIGEAPNWVLQMEAFFAANQRRIRGGVADFVESDRSRRGDDAGRVSVDARAAGRIRRQNGERRENQIRARIAGEDRRVGCAARSLRSPIRMIANC